MEYNNDKPQINLLGNPEVKESLERTKKNWDAKAEERRILQETLGAGIKGRVTELEIFGQKLYVVGTEEEDDELEKRLGIKFVSRP